MFYINYFIVKHLLGNLKEECLLLHLKDYKKGLTPFYYSVYASIIRKEFKNFSKAIFSSKNNLPKGRVKK